MNLNNLNGYTIKSINNDYYGNPRYIVNRKAFGYKDYKSIGGKKYRGKHYDDYIVFSTYNLYETLRDFLI